MIIINIVKHVQNIINHIKDERFNKNDI